MIYIYKFTNKTNNKIYIGQTNNPKKRFNQHKINKNNDRFHRAIRKYSINNFIFTILESVETREKANELEAYYIKKFLSNDPKYGYNTLISNTDNPSFHPEIVKQRTKKLLNDPEINKKLSHKYENNPRAGYTTEDVINIRNRRMNGERPSVVYEDYKHKDENIGYRAGFYKIWLHQSWMDIKKEYIGNYPSIDTEKYKKLSKNELTNSDYEEIKKDIETNQKYNIFYPKYKEKVDWNSFQKICKRYK